MGGDPFDGGVEGGPRPLQHLSIPLKILDSKEVRPYVQRELNEARERAAQITAREADIAALLKRIGSDQSKIRLTFGMNDPYFSPSKPSEKYVKMREQTMRYLDELAHTEVGFRLLTELDASPHKFEIVDWEMPKNDTTFTGDNWRNAYVPGKGAGSRISVNPNVTTFAVAGEQEQPWMTERVKYGLYHELVHAWHGTRGTVARGDHKEEPNAEWQAVGLGPFASEPITENKIREQMGKEPRPTVERKAF